MTCAGESLPSEALLCTCRSARTQASYKRVPVMAVAPTLPRGEPTPLGTSGKAGTAYLPQDAEVGRPLLGVLHDVVVRVELKQIGDELRPRHVGREGVVRAVKQ